MGAVQIDTLQVVHRSQYVALWSRLGAYDPADLDRLVYGDPAAPPGHNSHGFFEYWLHAACIIPWGYFCLPILHQDRLVGRFDPKLERQSGALRLKALYLEPGINPAEELVSSVAAAMRDFLRFHAATTLVIERSVPAHFGPKLLAVL